MIVHVGRFSAEIASRQKTHFASAFNRVMRVQMVREKYSSFVLSENMVVLSHPASSKRDVRVVTNVEAGCDGRESRVGRTRAGTDGEVVWSWHPGADAKFAML